MYVKKRLFILPIVILAVAFLIVPLVFMIVGSFQDDLTSKWTLSNYIEIFRNRYYSQSILNSLLIASLSSVLGIVGSFILCVCLIELPPRLQEKISFLSNIVSNYAGIPLAFSFIILLGNVGVLKIIFPVLQEFNLYSWYGLTIVYTYFQIPLGVLFLYPSMKEIKKDWLDSASVLGAKSLYTWKEVIIPFLKPSITTTFVILFANGMGTYETAYALTGSNINLLTVRISALVSGDVFAKPNLGSALSVFLGALLIIIMTLTQRRGKTI